MSTKIGTYKGQPASLVLIEEFYGKSKSLFQYECSCGDKFFTMCYALTHCEKKHKGVKIEELIRSKELIASRHELMAVYDACTANILVEFERQLQERLLVELMKHKQGLIDLEMKFKKEIDEPKREVKPGVIQPICDYVSVSSDPPGLCQYANNASTSCGPLDQFGFSQVSSVNYVPTTVVRSRIPVIGVSTFNADSYYDDFEENVSHQVLKKLGKRDRRSSMDSGYCQSPSFEPSEKRASIEEDTMDPVTGAKKMGKIVINLKNEKYAPKPKKVVVKTNVSCQTDPEPVKVTKHIAVQCIQETNTEEMVDRNFVLIPTNVIDICRYPVDPREERRSDPRSIYHPLRETRHELIPLSGFSVPSIKDNVNLLAAEEQERLIEKRNKMVDELEKIRLEIEREKNRTKDPGSATQESATPTLVPATRLAASGAITSNEVYEPPIYPSVHPIALNPVPVFQPVYNGCVIAPTYWKAQQQLIPQPPVAPALQPYCQASYESSPTKSAPLSAWQAVQASQQHEFNVPATPLATEQKVDTPESTVKDEFVLPPPPLPPVSFTKSIDIITLSDDEDGEIFDTESPIVAEPSPQTSQWGDDPTRLPTVTNTSNQDNSRMPVLMGFVNELNSLIAQNAQQTLNASVETRINLLSEFVKKFHKS